MSVRRHRGFLEHLQLDGPCGLCFACCNLDLVCLKGVQTWSWLRTGSVVVGDISRRSAKGFGVNALPLGRRRLVSFFVVLALMCRVGEAAVPGPRENHVPEWSLGGL